MNKKIGLLCCMALCLIGCSVPLARTHVEASEVEAARRFEKTAEDAADTTVTRIEVTPRPTEAPNAPNRVWRPPPPSAQAPNRLEDLAPEDAPGRSPTTGGSKRAESRLETSAPAAAGEGTTLDWRAGTVKAPPDHSVSVTVEERRPVFSEREDTKSKGSGASLLTREANALKEFNAGAPEVKLPTTQPNGVTAKGAPISAKGGGDGNGMSTGILVLIGVGGLAILGGAVLAIWARRIGLGIGLAVGGLALVGVAVLLTYYPWVVFIPIGIALAALVWLLVDSRRRQKVLDALTAVVRGVEKADEQAKADVKSSIQTEAGKDLEKVRDVVREVKREEGLENTAPTA